MREPRYSLLADIQYDIELARQGKFALYGQRNIAREYRCKKATPEEQQAYETLQNVLFMVPQWSDTEELHSDMERLGGRVWFCYFWKDHDSMILSVKIPVVPSRITSPSAYSPLRPDTHSKIPLQGCWDGCFLWLPVG